MNLLRPISVSSTNKKGRPTKGARARHATSAPSRFLHACRALLTGLLLLNSFAVAAQCPPAGHIILFTQQEVDDFVDAYPLCTNFTVTGNLTIGPSSPPDPANPNYDPVTDLSGLAFIDQIDGALTIQNTKIPDLDGLENLMSIGRGFFFTNNDDVLSIEETTDCPISMLSAMPLRSSKITN